jgi:ribonuclease HII
MAWIVGVDEAGYGPNLGPFVMTAAACRVPEGLVDADLWRVLHPVVRRAADGDDGRLLIDDSKAVYSTARGLAALEQGVLTAIRPNADSLEPFLSLLCADDVLTELRSETWYTGRAPVPLHVGEHERNGMEDRFGRACGATGVGDWWVRSVVVCPRCFNALLDVHETKGAVLGHAFAALLRICRDLPAADEMLRFHVDKHGGRNAYSALIHHALPDGIVIPETEGMAASAYRVRGLGREVRLTFRPRADADNFCVALASMTSKYIRERLMEEFNAFWQERMPGLKSTAGYPGDAQRFYDAIRPVAEEMGIAENRLWRRK